MGIVVVLALVLLVMGFLENLMHQRRLKRIPIRIHVNGTRGKSTTTRLIAGVLRNAGYRVIAKTTGTAARLILVDGSEIEVQRKRRPSIIEQVRVVAEAARHQAEVLVIECMAVNPEMQWISEHRIVQSTIGVITNVRKDHLDVMGPTCQDVASALALTIPASGELVVGDGHYYGFFQDKAARLGTSAHLAEVGIPNQDLDSFPYLMFSENVACAMKVGELLAVPPSVAWEGMAHVVPDPGSTHISKLEHSGVAIYFVNALAANDLTSTLLIWDKWQTMAIGLSLSHIPVIGLLHNRADRSFRVAELAELACSALPLDLLLLTGDLVPVTKRYLKKHGFQRPAVAGRRLFSVQSTLDDLSRRYQGDVVLFAYGNTQGFGQQLVDYFYRNGERIGDDVRSHRIGSGF